MKQPNETAGAVMTAPIPVDRIVPDPNNRKNHDQDLLKVFAEEIRVDGLLQPIVVRPIDGGKFMLIAGERRWRAHQILKRDTIEARVLPGEVQKSATRKRVAENFHRLDLTPIEKARDLESLFKDGMDQTEVAAFVGAKDQSTISNMMRLLKLPKKVQDWLQDGSVNAAQGKAFLRFEGRNKLVEAIAERAIDVGAPSKMLEKGLPFAEKLEEDGYVHNFGYLARSLADLPKEFQGDTDFIVSADEYGTDFIYCLDPNKGKMLHDRLEKERQVRVAAQSSSTQRRGVGGGMTSAEIAERKRQIEKNKGARATIDATFSRAWSVLKAATDIARLSDALRVVAAAALDSYQHSRRIKEAADALGLKASSAKDFQTLSPTHQVRVAAMAVLMRQCHDAKQSAAEVPAAATTLSRSSAKAEQPPRIAAKSAKQTEPRHPKAAKRATITDDTYVKVKRLVGEGRTGSEIAKKLGISLPSVQNCKKRLGLVRPSKGGRK